MLFRSDDSSASLTVLQGLNALLQAAPVKALMEVAASATASGSGAQLRAEGLPLQ